ncbi:acyl dehydratase [Burkholderia sp. D-99]|uniref:acyl dehydratase n=1 Tax=Burkholderia sp. D-99 TaxID=2717316 RepID=UPI001423898F|nr:acyl dehydratase [Burkholderia sp. D-99]NHV25916.1 acyl dehydratase [Burkholderia sp. D-99]
MTHEQRYWEDVIEGEALDSIAFPLTVYRLVMAAGSNRDFNSIHHNSEVARATGAPEMYANNYLLQGMWERTVRQYIGDAGTIRRLSGFRMRLFNTVGDTVVVKGRVARKWLEGAGFVELEMWSENSKGTSVGPGRIVAVLPTRSAQLA